MNYERNDFDGISEEERKMLIEMEELEELEELYYKEFKDRFPTMNFGGDLKKTIQECLDKKTPFKSRIPKGAIV